MSSFDIYVFILCLLVFVMLTGVFTYLIYSLFRLTVTLIRLGQQDEKIRTEYEAGTKKKGCLGEWLDRIVSLVLCVLLLIAFVFSVYVAVQDNLYFENVPTLKVVNSNSMAKRLSTNKYLYEHDLGNQFYTFDLICVYKTPDQYDLELYDIVVYQQDDIEVVHRIVGIEEPNVEHPDERYFLLQGDAVERPDRFPVHFSQIKAIYRGQRIPFVGSFVYFMQSPAGWLCILLVVFAMISSTLVNKRLTVAKNERLRLMGLLEEDDSDSTPPEDGAPAAQAEEVAPLP